jgi:hypothetical protein
MLKSEIGESHHVKCMVCSFVKGNDVILGLKANILEKHEENKGCLGHAALGQEIRRIVC